LRCFLISLPFAAPFTKTFFTLHPISTLSYKQTYTFFLFFFPFVQKNKNEIHSLFSILTHKVRFFIFFNFLYESSIWFVIQFNHRLFQCIVFVCSFSVFFQLFDYFPQPTSSCLVLWVSLFLIKNFRASSPKSNWEHSNQK
jgi:hypothetical protein